MDAANLEVDIAIIGAGLSGIAFARFFLDTHPACRLLLLEQDQSVGGVWSKDRVFDAFWVQSPLSMTSFSDITLELPAGAPQAHATFPARYVAEYLEHYIDAHVYEGETLRSRIHFGSRVEAAAKTANGWKLRIRSNALQTVQSIACKRLAVASGITSTPSLPAELQAAKERPPILHHREFGAREAEILAQASPYHHVTVIGGGKSAADMVYAALKANKKVNWLIRKTGGEGPGIFLNPEAPAPFTHAVEAGATRAATATNPSAFRPMTWLARMYHQCPTGRQRVADRIRATDQRCKQYANYRGRRGALPSFSELETRASFFWTSGPIGLIQRDDFWELVSQRVSVFCADIEAYDSTNITLTDGRVIESDIVLCATGWKEDYPFFTQDQICELGLPYRIRSTDTKADSVEWDRLVADATEKIKQEYPILAYEQSKLQQSRNAQLAPGKLWRGIASLEDPSVVFLGRARVANNFRSAEAQAIWATAYWDGRVALPASKQELREDIAFHIAFSRLRYPTRGADGLNFHGDLIWYTDTLAYEAGLRSHRKAWWSDWNKPIVASDFGDCKDEYLSQSAPRAHDLVSTAI